ncbi:MAG: hypothetical protein IT458_18060 [Planctomycetes bacterium]|nr:hypothetical protein [Planctomycetota bacterium]
MPRLATLGWSFALAAPLAAQVAGTVDSPLSGLPQGLSVDGATFSAGLPLDRTRVYAKPAGFQATAPVPPVPIAGRPDFRVEALFPGLAVRPDLDAMSIGIDWISGDDVGHAFVLPGHWAALTFSVTRGTLAAAGSRIALEVPRPDGAAGDVFCYVLPGGEIDAALQDQVSLAQDSPQIAIWSPGQPGNLDAHDLFLTLYGLDPAFLAFLPPNPTFYFSVTTASLGAVPPAWWAGTTPSGATILGTTWGGAAWGPVSPFLTHAQLGLPAGADVDALAVDTLQARILFSTTTGLPDPILFGKLLGAAVAVSIYRMPSEQPVSKRIGLVLGDDVDAICALDPGSQNQLLRGFAIGTAQPPLLPFLPGRIAASAWRGFRAPSGPTLLRTAMAGWPPAGQGPGLAALFVGFGSNPLMVHAATLSRNPGNPFGGDPKVLDLPIPSHIVLQGVAIDLTWAAIDTGTGTYDLARPVRIRL